MGVYYTKYGKSFEFSLGNYNLKMRIPLPQNVGQ